MDHNMSVVPQDTTIAEPVQAAQAEGPDALSVEGVSHSYGKRKALDNVSFSVKPSSFTVLLGLNGAGKSTLFSLITRLYSTQTGTIKIFGYEVGRESGEALRRLGVVFQARTLDMDLSIQQNLLYHAALHGIGTKETEARSALVLEQLGMTDRAKDKVRDLSGGQMRRIEIARALLHHPQMLLLDEPTVGLDIKARADILAHVRALVHGGIGVLWTTHLIDEVYPEDDVVVLHQGKILDKGKVSDVVARAGVADMRAAFTKLTGSGPVGSET
jgi:ABC-2 type transport system ATP-binding protein